MNQYGTDFSKGSIPRHLLYFSIPMLISSLIQVFHNIVDTVWVGHLVGENAVGAVGVSFPVIFLIIGISIGLTTAATVLVSQHYGAGREEMVSCTVGNAFTITLIVSVVLSVVSYLACGNILEAMNTPPENIVMATGYLRIIFLGLPFMFLGALIAAILRGIGDTITPLIFLSSGVVINAILDPLLIGGFGPFPKMELNGAALATSAAQLFAFLFSIVYLNKKGHALAFSPSMLKFKPETALSILKIGFPTMIQQSLISLGMIFITGLVNSFGNQALNAFGAAARVDSFAIMPAMSISMAVSAITGQNIGAEKYERVGKVFKWGLIMTAAITLSVSVLIMLFSENVLLSFGMGIDSDAMDIGKSYLHIVGASYIFFAFMFISNGVIIGAGKTLMTMIFSLVSLWFVRVPVAYWLSQTGLGIDGIWTAIALSSVIMVTVSFLYYYSGRWKSGIAKGVKTETAVESSAD